MDKFELEVINHLRELKVPAHLRGYEYIKTALNCLREDPDIIWAITKELYPAVAEKFNILKPQRVERGIRHALTFVYMDLVVLKKVLGTSSRLTNGEFLATLHEVIRVKMAGEHFEL